MKGKAKEFAKFIQDKFDLKVTVCNDSNEVVRNADVLVTATSSTTPFFTEALKPGTHVNAVGSFRPSMQELPSHAISSATKVIVEAEDAALEETGDLLVPIQEGVFSESGIHAELGKVVSGERPVGKVMRKLLYSNQ